MVSVTLREGEIISADYDSRRTRNWFSDRGSIPLRSTKQIKSGLTEFGFFAFMSVKMTACHKISIYVPYLRRFFRFTFISADAIIFL